MAGAKKVRSKRGRTQPLLAGFQVRKESTEGSLGGWLAQRQAALRGQMAAGLRINFASVFRTCRLSLEQLACHRKRFVESADN